MKPLLHGSFGSFGVMACWLWGLVWSAIAYLSMLGEHKTQAGHVLLHYEGIYKPNGVVIADAPIQTLHL